MELLRSCLETCNEKEIASQLNVSPGTVKRWILLGDVPVQYTFDLSKMLKRDIDYTLYSSTLKDQFFTPSDIALGCWQTFINETDIHLDDYTFIEPSAGDGSFLKVLPKGSIGLDVEPRGDTILKQDFLSWHPPCPSKKYIVFGNPPFGLRGHMALKFINHASSFADYVCFILPQLFESDGKGSPRKRVLGYNLVYSEKLSGDFYAPDSSRVKVNGVFQIWSKHTQNTRYMCETQKSSGVKVFSLSDGGTVASTRNKDMIGKCDIYLPSTCFGKENMKAYNSFEELPNKRGYGLVFTEHKEAMVLKVKSMEWHLLSFLSTNSAYNLRTSLIIQNIF